MIQQLGRWLRALARWLVEPWRVWAPIVAVLFALLAASRLPLDWADAVLRYCGLAFQLLGIGMVALGLRDKGRLFDRPTLREKIRRWFARRPRWNAKTQTRIVTATGTLSISADARASMWRGTPADACVADRLAALEANLVTLKTEHAETAKQLQEATRKANEAIEAERQARESGITTLRVKLEGLGAGGLHIEWTGVFWLLVGVVLATIPGEIAFGLQVLFAAH